MQDQIYRILSSRSGKPLRQIIRDTKRTDFYLDAQSALDYGLIDAIVAGELPEPKLAAGDGKEVPAPPVPAEAPLPEAAIERPAGSNGTDGTDGTGRTDGTDRGDRKERTANATGLDTSFG